ncbi:hypothetical protein PQR75_45110 [Paraburkholderia fungorum]|uniref:hypothetical protein n=1 Tax=Paraburkholderia fungorum TaxID=134537 RepID=UPI0038B8620A
MRATGFFTPPTDQHAVTFEGPKVGPPVSLDLVPFGRVEAPQGAIAWPPMEDFVMNVLGFREAVDTPSRSTSARASSCP